MSSQINSIQLPKTNRLGKILSWVGTGLSVFGIFGAQANIDTFDGNLIALIIGTLLFLVSLQLRIGKDIRLIGFYIFLAVWITTGAIVINNAMMVSAIFLLLLIPFGLTIPIIIIIMRIRVAQFERPFKRQVPAQTVSSTASDQQ